LFFPFHHQFEELDFVQVIVRRMRLLFQVTSMIAVLRSSILFLLLPLLNLSLECLDAIQLSRGTT